MSDIKNTVLPSAPANAAQQLDGRGIRCAMLAAVSSSLCLATIVGIVHPTTRRTDGKGGFEIHDESSFTILSGVVIAEDDTQRIKAKEFTLHTSQLQSGDRFAAFIVCWNRLTKVFCGFIPRTLEGYGEMIFPPKGKTPEPLVDSPAFGFFPIVSDMTRVVGRWLSEATDGVIRCDGVPIESRMLALEEREFRALKPQLEADWKHLNRLNLPASMLQGGLLMTVRSPLLKAGLSIALDPKACAFSRELQKSPGTLDASMARLRLYANEEPAADATSSLHDEIATLRAMLAAKTEMPAPAVDNSEVEAGLRTALAKVEGALAQSESEYESYVAGIATRLAAEESNAKALTEARAEVELYQEEIATLQAQLEKLRAEILTAGSGEVEALRAANTELRSKVDEAEAFMRMTQETLEREVEERTVTLTTENRTLKGKVDEVEIAMVSYLNEAAGAKTALVNTQQEAKQLQIALDDSRMEYAGLLVEKEELQKQLDARNAPLSPEQDDAFAMAPGMNPAPAFVPAPAAEPAAASVPSEAVTV